MKFRVSRFKPMTAVYTFLFPEAFAAYKAVQALITPELFRVGTSVKEARGLLRDLVTPALDIPGKGGMLDLDELHVCVTERLIQAYAQQVPGLRDFAWRYPSGGSSEGIFHLLTQLKVKGVKHINVLQGEYEGYGAQAKNLGMQCSTWNSHEPHIWRLDPCYWFISNPSAINGNILPPEFLKRLLDRGHKVVLDLAYVGATAPNVFDVSHPNITALVMSFSKPYGVFRLRAGGQIFSREEVPSLYGNKWFKDIERQLLTAKLAVDIGPSGLYSKYRPVQEAIVAAVNQKFGLQLQPSDNLLTAYMPVMPPTGFEINAGWLSQLAPFRREDWYRFCLTPYLEDAGKQRLY